MKFSVAFTILLKKMLKRVSRSSSFGLIIVQGKTETVQFSHCIFLLLSSSTLLPYTISLEKGHTQNQGDSVHSTIERAGNRKLLSYQLNVPEEWYCLVRWARTDGEPYLVREMKGEEFYDIKSLLNNKNLDKEFIE